MPFFYYISKTMRKWEPPARPLSPFIPRSLSQLVNLLQVGSSLGISLLTRRAVIWGRPLAAHIEPTSLCNLHCPLCPSGNGKLTRQRSRMTLNDFIKIIDRLPSSVRLLLLWNQGEPFLVRDLVAMIRYGKQRDLYVTTSTNGHFFNRKHTVKSIVQSGIDEIIISLDGTTQEVYERYRIGGKLGKVLAGMRSLAEAKRELGSSTPLIHLQFILMRHNLHQREDIIRLGRQNGADRLSFKTVQVTSFPNGESFLPEDLDLTRYSRKTDEGQYITRKRRFFPDDCLRLWYSMVINSDGKVSPCCFDKDGDYSPGNLLEEPFDRIWYGSGYQQFRQHLLNARYHLEMCRDCSEGLKILFPTIHTFRENDQHPDSKRSPISHPEKISAE